MLPRGEFSRFIRRRSGSCMPKLGTKVLIIDYEPRSHQATERPPGRARAYETSWWPRTASTGMARPSRSEKARSRAMIEAMLPKRHGFEVCQELKADRARPPHADHHRDLRLQGAEVPQPGDPPLRLPTSTWRSRSHSEDAAGQAVERLLSRQGCRRRRARRPRHPFRPPTPAGTRPDCQALGSRPGRRTLAARGPHRQLLGGRDHRSPRRASRRRQGQRRLGPRPCPS